MNESGGGEGTGTRPGGIASAAVTALTTWAFAQLRLHRVELCHAVANRVAAGAGYPAEGILRESYRYGDGRRYDEHPHARLATDG
ncbi:GNAT family protein [Micromonospora sp. 4G57]|uniref:GNAT family protein n=1 Tax=Micromonospora sicca TaxID=2202420 RepID=A0ABU5JL77_9ACTN|nr:MULTISPECIES: GNAT family protein [unclassified Micromonospora]MDZ5446596.1 GNAT family protein [Micromonospora sp. 4G57]MDZ5493292.1 GNAT family protein [Micromonospora sp. 4G53]